MKVTLLFLLTFTQQLNAQDSLYTTEDYDFPLSNPRPYEVAYTIVGANSNQVLPFVEQGTPIFEFLNGILARYKYQKISLRFHASYFYKKTSREYDRQYLDRDFGRAIIKDYKIGTGLQYSFFKKQEYIYTFLDLSYRKRLVTADIYNAQLNNYTNLISKLNGIDIIPGIGSKIKLLKNLYLSIEVGYDYTYTIGKSTYNNYQYITQESKNETLTYSNLFTKVYLSLTF